MKTLWSINRLRLNNSQKFWLLSNRHLLRANCGATSRPVISLMWTIKGGTKINLIWRSSMICKGIGRYLREWLVAPLWRWIQRLRLILTLLKGCWMILGTLWRRSILTRCWIRRLSWIIWIMTIRVPISLRGGAWTRSWMRSIKKYRRSDQILLLYRHYCFRCTSAGNGLVVLVLSNGG